MDEYEREWIREVRENAGKLALQIDKDSIDKLLLAYALDDECKPELKEEIDSLIDTFSRELLFSKKPLLECPTRTESEGEIKIGRVLAGDKVLWDFNLTGEELNQHMLITARSGAGKTTLIMQIMRQLLSRNIPFVVLDFKLDYRHLMKLYPQLLVVNWKHLKINPLEPPPGVSFQEWKQQFLNIFGHVEGIWQGSTQHLLRAMDEVYEEKKAIPKMEDVYNKIAGTTETSRKMQEYASVVETRLYGLLSKLGETINNEKTAIDMEKLLQMPVILELHGLGRDEATILALWLFYWIYAYRRAQGMRGKLLHVLITDEAKRIFTGSEQYSQTTAEYSGIPPADLVCDEIRDFGEAILASDQEPTKLSHSLKANTYTKATGFLGNGKDVSEMAEAMDLDEEEREAITKLERGEWLVKLAGKYTKPFMIKSEDFPLKKDVTDEQVAERMESIFGSYLPTEEPNNKIELKPRLVLPQISDDAWSLLLDINSHPFRGVTSRYKSLNFSGRRATSAKIELLAKRLATEVEVVLGGFRPVKFLVPTDLAINMLKNIGHDVRLWRHTGHMGFHHQLYTVLIAYTFRGSGHTTSIEKTLQNGRRVDVLTTIEDKTVAIEVETGTNIDLDGKLRALDEVDQLIIVTDNNEAMEQAKARQSSDKLKVYHISDFLRFIRANYSNNTSRNKSDKFDEPNHGDNSGDKLGGKEEKENW